MEILDLDELVALDKKTSWDKISLQLLAEYYSAYLMNKTYRFAFEGDILIDLKFENKDFCHLTGVQQVAEHRLKSDAKKRRRSTINTHLYSGKGGFNRVKNDKITFSGLKNVHSGYYMNKFEKEEKCLFFHLIHRLLSSDNLKVVGFTAVPDSNITCELIFHDTYDNALLHLGIEKDSKGTHYFPRTFFARYLSKTNYDKFVTGRAEVPILSREVIESPIDN